MAVPDIPAEALARARLLQGVAPNLIVAGVAGLSRSAYYRHRAALGILPAKPARPKRKTRAPRLPSLASLAAEGPIDRVAVGQAMERFIGARVAACEAEAASGSDPEPERTARTIAHYARALGLVRSYLAEIEKDNHGDAEAPMRTLSELRDELRGHLERIWDEGRDAGRLGRAGPDREGA